MRLRASLFLIASVTAFAQVTPATLKLGDVVVSGSFRTRAYGWDWFQPASGDNSYAYSGNVLRVNFAQKKDRWEWNAELAAPILLGLPDNATASAPQGALGFGSNYYTANGTRNTASVFAKQAYVRFKGIGSSTASSLQVGRFEFNDGSELAPKNATLATIKRDRISQRLIGSFGWSDVGRSFDGLRYSYTKAKDDVTVLVATPTRGVFQADGWGWNRAGFAYAAYTHETEKGGHATDSRLFVLHYDDWRNVLKTDNRPVGLRRGDTQKIQIETFGAHHLQSIDTSAGAFDAVAWGAVQTGSWGTQKHRAYSLDFEGGWQPRLHWKSLARLKPWFRGGVTMSSGDSNPNDSRHGTFFQVLPTPRPYARMPFYNMMNTQDRFGALILRPHTQWTVSAEFHSIRLANANDLWYSGGGVFQPWTFGYAGRSTSGRRSLGNLYDVSAEYRLNRRVTLNGYYGFAQGRAAISQIYPDGSNGAFGYLEAVLRF